MKESTADARPDAEAVLPEAIDNYNYDGGRVFSTGVQYLGANAPYHVTGYAPGYALAPVAEGNYAKLKVEESRWDGKTDFLSCDGNAEHMGWTGNPFTRKEHELKFRHLTACISFAVDYYLDPDSIYTKQLLQRGEHLTHDKDQSVFVFLKLDELMETDFLRIKENMTLGDIVHIISTARRNIFPVIDNFGRLLGVVQLDDLREDMFKPEKYGRPISDYMIAPPDRILEHESIMSVMEKFEDKHTWMLPVVDKKNRYLGFISKSRILNAYREQLVKIQQ